VIDSICISTSLPLGTVTSVRSRVRMRVLRRPMVSTKPTMPSRLIWSPTRKGWSMPIEKAANRFSPVFCAASARARPPMPRPAIRLATEKPISPSTPTIAMPQIPALITRPPSGTSARLAG